jgi:hypothetical protein
MIVVSSAETINKIIKQLIYFMVVSFPPHHSPALLQKCILSILLLDELNNLSSVFDSVQVSDAYVSIDVTSTNTSMFRFSLISSATLGVF